MALLWHGRILICGCCWFVAPPAQEGWTRQDDRGHNGVVTLVFDGHTFVRIGNGCFPQAFFGGNGGPTPPPPRIKCIIMLKLSGHPNVEVKL